MCAGSVTGVRYFMDADSPLHYVEFLFYLPVSDLQRQKDQPPFTLCHFVLFSRADKAIVATF
jgi:hypothetical protein